jgi:hypothetical protein
MVASGMATMRGAASSAATVALTPAETFAKFRAKLAEVDAAAIVGGGRARVDKQVRWLFG